jgi:site-specific recombinase XerD
MKLSEAIELFIDRPEIRPASRKTYGNDLNHLKGFIGAERPLADILPLDLLRYSNYLNKDENIQSPFTFNKHVKSLRTFFNWCVKAHIIETSPAAVLRRKKLNESVPKSKAMPDSKLIRLLEYVAETPRGWNPREEALVRFLADTGCRISGAASLTEENIDLKERSAKLYEKGKVDPHIVRFGIECAQAIAAWLLKRKATKGSFVFSTEGQRMSNSDLGNYFRRLCIRSGIGSWGPHSLRHRMGHKAIEKFPVSIVAKMLGDTVDVVIKHYLPQDDEAVQKAMLDMTTDHLVQEQTEVIELPKKRTL